MPSRIIKESITTSESLSEVSAEAERLFWRLVVKADDFGLYYGNPRILASMCFPLDPPKEQRIRAWLDELVAAGMVGTYTSDEDGKKYLKLLSKDGRLEKVKALLGITGTDQDEVLLFVIQTVEDLVLAYINQDTLPAPLENALIVMCVSYYKAAGLGTTQAAVGPVASVKRGDVTTSFANASGASGSASTFNLGAEGDDFFGWRTVLNEFRRLRW